MKTGRAADWLPDIAANMLAVTMIVLIALALVPAPVARDGDVARSTPLIFGPEAVAMLHDRVRATRPAIDLLADGVRILPGEGAPDAFVFDHAHAAALEGARRQMSVPRALRNPDGSDWSDAFLALAAAPDRAAFQRDLIALLSAETSASRPQRRTVEWGRVTLTALNIAAAAATLWMVARLFRRARRPTA